MTRRPLSAVDRLAVAPRPPLIGTVRNPDMCIRLIDAGGHVIGRHGYAGCTIARVTARARIAHGTFYLHFSSRQAFFDTLLPTLGARLLRTIGRAVAGCRDLLELERRSFVAGFAYCARHPYIARVLFEAEQFAQGAFAAWNARVVSGYASALRRCARGRPLAVESDAALEALATMLIGARSHLMMRYAIGGGQVTPLSGAQIDAYLALVGPRLTGAAPT